MSGYNFVAFSSSDSLLVDTITAACQSVQRSDMDFIPWNSNDPSGRPIDESVHGWIENADEFTADVSEPNHNVTYEIGLAIGMRKPVRLIRASNRDRKSLESIGLLHNLGHDDYHGRENLSDILNKGAPVSPWPRKTRNRGQPLYLLRSSDSEELLRRLASNIKKTLKLRFRDFNPKEIDRLTATEAFEQVSQSFGIIA